MMLKVTDEIADALSLAALEHGEMYVKHSRVIKASQIMLERTGILILTKEMKNTDSDHC